MKCAPQLAYSRFLCTQPKVIKSSERVTLLNFFSCGVNKPLPIPPPRAVQKKKHAPKKTRVAKFGRPCKIQEPESERQEKIETMRKAVKRKCADGALCVTPKKRMQWSGPVMLTAHAIY